MLWHWFGAMVWRMNIARIDIARMWPGVYAWTGLTLACSQRGKVGALQLHLSCMHTYIHTCSAISVWTASQEDVVTAVHGRRNGLTQCAKNRLMLWQKWLCIRAANWMLSFLYLLLWQPTPYTSLSFCGQVLVRSGIVIGPMTLGQARFSS